MRHKDGGEGGRGQGGDNFCSRPDQQQPQDFALHERSLGLGPSHKRHLGEHALATLTLKLSHMSARHMPQHGSASVKIPGLPFKSAATAAEQKEQLFHSFGLMFM